MKFFDNWKKQRKLKKEIADLKKEKNELTKIIDAELSQFEKGMYLWLEEKKESDIEFEKQELEQIYKLVKSRTFKKLRDMAAVRKMYLSVSVNKLAREELKSVEYFLRLGRLEGSINNLEWILFKLKDLAEDYEQILKQLAKPRKGD